MALILEGIIVGLSIAAPVGAIGFLCIQQTLRGGIPLGIASGLGAATADMMYGILVALGLSALQNFFLQYRVYLTLIGGLFLCYLGVKKFLSVPPSTEKIRASQSGLLKAAVVTFFLTLTNPATILDFMALFTGLSIDISAYTDSLSFVAGVFLGSSLWWFILCFTVGLFRHRVSEQLLQYVNYLAGIVIFGFGVYSLSKVIG